MRIFVTVAYDIADDRARTRASDCLFRYHGKRVNKSVFECFLSKKQFSELKAELKQLADKKTDSIVYYRLCRECIEGVERYGGANIGREPVKVV